MRCMCTNLVSHHNDLKNSKFVSIHQFLCLSACRSIQLSPYLLSSVSCLFVVCQLFQISVYLFVCICLSQSVCRCNCLFNRLSFYCYLQIVVSVSLCVSASIIFRLITTASNTCDYCICVEFLIARGCLPNQLTVLIRIFWGS